MATTKVGFQLASSLASKHLTDAEFIKGSYFVVDTYKHLTEKNEDNKYKNYIPASSSEDGTIIDGSLCYCQEDSKFYQYVKTGVVNEEDTYDWVEAKLSGAGLETGEGENSIQLTEAGSQALSEASAALGSETMAGVKGFYWTAIDCTTVDWTGGAPRTAYSLCLATTTFDEGPVYATDEEIQANFAVGDILTIHAGSKYDKQFEVIDPSIFVGPLASGSIQVAHLTDISGVLETNEYKAGMGFSDNAIFCPAKPQNGVADFGLGAISGGEKSKAINYAATAFGRKNEAYGQYATAVGRENKVGYAGFAAGRNNTVSGESAAAINQGNTASGNHSFAGGYAAQATKQKAFAFGQSAKAEGDHAIALGYQAQASSEGSIALGSNAKANTNSYAVAIGHGATASGKFAVAIGNGAVATKEGAVAIGNNVSATGTSAFAEGYNTKAVHDYAHTEGYNTTTLAIGGHTEGHSTKAGYFAHAEGEGCVASEPHQHVQGKYNKLEDNGTAGNYAHIIGGGHANDNRKNIHTVDWQGNAWYAGDIKIEKALTIGTAVLNEEDLNKLLDLMNKVIGEGEVLM